MTKYIKMCHPDCTIKDAVQIMENMNCGAVPVINDDLKPVGVVTDRDIAIYTVLNNKKPDESKLQEFMSKSPITCFQDDDIDVAIQKMKEHKIRRILIVDEQNKLVGIISLGDIAVVTNELGDACEALQDISTPVSSSK